MIQSDTGTTYQTDGGLVLGTEGTEIKPPAIAPTAPAAFITAVLPTVIT